MLRNQILSGGSPTEGQPDKLCDLLADAILDRVIAEDRFGRVAVDCMVSPGLVMLAGQITTKAYVDITGAVREAVADIGYTDPDLRFESRSIAVLSTIEEQSEDVALAVDRRGAGNRCVSVGYATNEADKAAFDTNLMPAPLWIAHKMSKALSDTRKAGGLPFLYPDGHVMVTLEYEDNVPTKLRDVTVCAHHRKSAPLDQVRKEIMEKVGEPSLKQYSSLVCDECRVRVNPYGSFTLGGPLADTGQTGRKSVSDTYGAVCAFGGSALSGKDPTKTDRASVYMARYLAKNLVAAGVSERIEVRLVYHFGSPEPVSVQVNTYGERLGDERDIENELRRQFDLSSPGIIETLMLRKVRYAPASCYGHLGRTDIDLPWENVDKVDDLKKALT